MELTKEWVEERLPQRDKDGNKGTFGKVLVIAGSANFPGAAFLCCAAAYRVGAGLVTLVTEREAKIIVSRKLPELTYLSFTQAVKQLKDFDVVLLGPGLGQGESAVKLVKQLIKEKLPTSVIDGDGLNILSKIDKWWERLHTEVILTPHPGEMSRLTGLTIDEIQKRRKDIAHEFAEKWRLVVVLKGANTIIASPAGEMMISPFANPLLATAGTGDVLAGIIAGMMAQGLQAFAAACVGVYIHGLAAEYLKEEFGNTGMLASDLLPTLPKVILHIQTLNQLN